MDKTYYPFPPPPYYWLGTNVLSHRLLWGLQILVAEGHCNFSCKLDGHKNWQILSINHNKLESVFYCVTPIHNLDVSQFWPFQYRIKYNMCR